MKASLLVVVCGVALAAASACRGPESQLAASTVRPSSCDLALAPFAARLDGDETLAALQESARVDGPRTAAQLENLAYRFVRRARLSYDGADYTRADAAARCLEERHPGDRQAALLRGHVLHQQHRFAEAEAVARQLVRDRGDALDYGLLGDALMEQGRLDQAVDAYQQMADRKPHFQSYTRAAHVRWLRGDLDGARTMMLQAVRSASPRDGESLAWAETRLALYEWQAGRADEAAALVGQALARQPGYAPALLARGRLLLSSGRATDAVAPLRQAASIANEPDYQWTLVEALRAAGDAGEAERVEHALDADGARRDPRTFALFASTRALTRDARPGDAATAVDLVAQERERRQDVFTLDAAAWALAAVGRADEAYAVAADALAVGTKDARLLYHAAVIASLAGHDREARARFAEARALGHMLLPSERQDLLSRAAGARGRTAAHHRQPSALSAS
ncbi:MAG: tetratricopeptide repeat protein [Vicinamibacterales bacterium]